jgi:hypothetical protein
MPRKKPLSMNDIVTNAYDGLDNNLALKVYESGTIMYVCTAEPGSALSSALWKIMKFDTSLLVITWCDGNSNYDNLATDLATVAALSYS